MFKNYLLKLSRTRVLLTLCFVAASVAGGGLRPCDLSTEYSVNPVGLDAGNPRFGWKLQSNERGQFQSAYQLRVATSPKLLDSAHPDIWDTGKVPSDQSLEVVYAGAELKSGTRYYWKARVWDKDGKSSDWSAEAFFETGLLHDGDWQGKWIGHDAERIVVAKDPRGEPISKPDIFPAPLLRKEFAVAKPVQSARLYICGLGLYDLGVNGRKVDDSVLNPAQTQYAKTVLYVTHDITRLIHPGANCVGVELGRGFFDIRDQTPWNWNRAPWIGSPRMICQLNIKYQDGTTDSVVSDSSWQLCTDGPTRYDSIYWGENYDARKEKPGWNLPGYNLAGFDSADILPAPSGRLEAQMIPPMRIVETRKPVKVSQPKPDCYVFDLGFVTTGWAQFTAACPAGTKITIRYSERLNGDGTANQFGLNQANEPCQTDTYCFKGRGKESWEPKFSYKGFKFVEVSGCPVSLSTNDIEIKVVHTTVRTIGTFNCSNPLFNTLHENTVRTILNNLQGKPTDTPTYEKNGWMGDGNIILETALYNFDMTCFFEKWVDDMRDCMADNGLMPVIVPTGGWGMGHSPEWNSAYVFAPWHLYQYCNDQQILRRQYPGLKKYADYESTVLNDHVSKSILNDWAAVGADTRGSKPGRGCAAPEGGTLTSTAYTYRALQLMVSIAELNGRHQDAERYAAICQSIRESFNRHFFKPEKNYYETGIPAGYRQTSTILPLAFDIAPESNRRVLVDNLVADIKSKDNHLSTGCLGTKYILPVLTEAGAGDIAYAIANQRTYPSWGWWVAKGATTMWETWEETCRSNDHYFFGTVDEWFYKYLAGIRCESNGFKTITIKPYILGDLTSASATVNSVRGPVVSTWNLKPDEVLKLVVVIPPGSTATVWVPVAHAAAVKEGGHLAEQSPGITLLRHDNGYDVFQVVSGKYSFYSNLKSP